MEPSAHSSGRAGKSSISVKPASSKIGPKPAAFDSQFPDSHRFESSELLVLLAVRAILYSLITRKCFHGSIAWPCGRRLSTVTWIPHRRSVAFPVGVVMKFGGIRFVLCISLLILVPTVPVLAAENAHLLIDASKPGAKIDRNLFGQFAENLGHGLYEGIWVGPDSPIPNTRGIRNDVVTALRALKVPNVRWPGGCFADQYHWRKGIGPAAQRPATLNSAWGGVVDTNSFGTHEFMDFLQQIDRKSTRLNSSHLG